MKKIYIHVGIPKTGTTFLQERCFPHLTGVHYVHTTNYAPVDNTGLMDVLNRLVYTNPALFDVKKATEDVNTLLDSVAEHTVLISWERLFGNMFANYYDNFYLTSNLKGLFPTARIIMVIRKQDDLLESIYRQSLHTYHYQTVSGFLNYRNKTFGDACHRVRQPNLDVKQFDFHRYVRNYVELFGRENVAVLTYEFLRHNQREFLDTLFGFMEVEPFYPDENGSVHESYSLLSCYIALLLNRFVRIEGDGSRLLQFIPNEPFSSYLAKASSNGRFHKMLTQINRRLSLRYFLQHAVDRIAPAKGRLINREKRKLIMDIHKESNRRLDEEFGLGLKRFEYWE